jgi:hypothetical protein
MAGIKTRQLHLNPRTLVRGFFLFTIAYEGYAEHGKRNFSKDRPFLDKNRADVRGQCYRSTAIPRIDFENDHDARFRQVSQKANIGQPPCPFNTNRCPLDPAVYKY